MANSLDNRLKVGPITITDPPPTYQTPNKTDPVLTIPRMPTAPTTVTPVPNPKTDPVLTVPRQPTAPTTVNPIPPAQPAQGLQGGNTGIVPQPVNAPPASFGAGNVVQDYMNNLTQSNSPYMQNARRRGLEFAASRGNLNSSIAAGSSQRAALEAAQPMVNQMVDLHKSRESYASQDWLNNNTFNREFNAGLALLPIKNSFDMLNTLMSYGAENPAVYTPTVMSGLSNFFTQNMQDIMSNYFGGSR